MQNHISYIKLNRRWDYFRHWKIREKKPRFFGGLTYYLRSRCQLVNKQDFKILVNFTIINNNKSIMDIIFGAFGNRVKITSEHCEVSATPKAA